LNAAGIKRAEDQDDVLKMRQIEIGR
jgi:hypothetical protein